MKNLKTIQELSLKIKKINEAYNDIKNADIDGVKIKTRKTIHLGFMDFQTWTNYYDFDADVLLGALEILKEKCEEELNQTIIKNGE